jgi:hypothetical protein
MGIRLAFGCLDHDGDGNAIAGNTLNYMLLGGALDSVNATFPHSGISAAVLTPGGLPMDGLALFSPAPVNFNFAAGGFSIRMAISSSGLEPFTEKIHNGAGSFKTAGSPIKIP